MRVCQILATALIFATATPTIAAELKIRPPEKPFDAYTPPPSPDYNDKKSWVVWPGRPSKADVIPGGINGELARNPKADVFFIHPTTYLTNTTWNAKFDEGDFTGQQLEDGVLRYQVSVFNGCCRIYAPRYRQSTLSAFLSLGENAYKAFDLAYSDVLRAFEHYIANENNGRPFVLASHSQGSLHASRLLQQRITTDPELSKRLVVAYVVGAAIPDTKDYSGLPVCDSATQTGCMVDWNTTSARTILALGRRNMAMFADGKYTNVGNNTWMCVNPLNWQRNGAAAASANQGALPLAGLGKPLPSVMKAVTGARCTRGRLAISIPWLKRKNFKDPLTGFGSYHNQDYSLFYANIRKNAIDRVNAFTR